MASRADELARGAGPADDERDLLDVLMSIRDPDGSSTFAASEITGMFISMMFAGHHTSSGTAAWTLIELLRNPGEMTGVVARVSGTIRVGGTGEILFSQTGARRSAPARSEDSSTIERGTEVVVMRYEHGIAYVRRWDELAGESP